MSEVWSHSSAGIVSAQNETHGQSVNRPPALEELKQLYETVRNKRMPFLNVQGTEWIRFPVFIWPSRAKIFLWENHRCGQGISAVLSAANDKRHKMPIVSEKDMVL